VSSKDSTRFLNCSIVNVVLLDLGIALRVKTQELRKCKKSCHLITFTEIIPVWLKIDCSDKKWKKFI